MKSMNSILVAGYMVFCLSAPSEQADTSGNKRSQGGVTTTNAPTQTAGSTNSLADTLEIKRVIFRHLGIDETRTKSKGINTKTNASGELRYGVVEVEPNEVAYFRELYKDIPNIIVWGSNDSAGTKSNKVGTVVHVFSITIRTNEAVADAGRYYGSLGGEVQTYSLTNHNGQWSITNVKLKIVM